MNIIMLFIDEKKTESCAMDLQSMAMLSIMEGYTRRACAPGQRA